MSWYRGATRHERVAAAMEAHELDVLLALTPENAEYLSGQRNYIASHWRLPGLAAAAIGRAQRLAVVTGDAIAGPNPASRSPGTGPVVRTPAAKAPIPEMGDADASDADELALIDRAGIDPKDFEELYLRYFEDVFRFCDRMLGSREDAEDATAAIFTKALTAFPSFQGSSFRRWLFAIAANVVRDRLRSRGAEPDLAADPAPADDPPPLQLARLKSLLDTLPPQQRMVIEFRLAGLSLTEIATLLGVSRETVIRRSHRAVHSLRSGLPSRSHPDQPPEPWSPNLHTYRLWIEHIDLRDLRGSALEDRIRSARPGGPVARPEQFELDDVYDCVAAAVHSVSPFVRRIGVDLRAVPSQHLALLRGRLAGVRIEDASVIFDDLRAIKDVDEIAHLRLASKLTIAGIKGARDRLVIGMTEAAVNAAFQIAVQERVMADPRFAAFRQAEGQATVGIGAEQPKTVGGEVTVKFDMQVDVGGYHSDIGRTFAFSPTDDQRRIHDALHKALRVAKAKLQPGATFAEVWLAGTKAMHAAGFTNYSRGQLGHSVGLAHYFEEPPFIAPNEHRTIQPGMVLSLELPYDVYGVGAFQLERTILITETGNEALDPLPFELSLG